MTRTCPSCGRGNRVAARRLADTARCGACKATLPPVSTPVTADEATFDEIVTTSPVPVLVDFWAEWCGPCRAAAPSVAATAAALAGRALVVKVDIEAHPAAAARYGVRGIPTFLVMHRGKVVHQHVGVAPAADMQKWLQDAMAATA